MRLETYLSHHEGAPVQKRPHEQFEHRPHMICRHDSVDCMHQRGVTNIFLSQIWSNYNISPTQISLKLRGPISLTFHHNLGWGTRVRSRANLTRSIWSSPGPWCLNLFHRFFRLGKPPPSLQHQGKQNPCAHHGSSGNTQHGSHLAVESCRSWHFTGMS